MIFVYYLPKIVPKYGVMTKQKWVVKHLDNPFFIYFGSLSEQIALCVSIYLARKHLYALNKSPDTRNNNANATAEKCDKQLSNSFSRITEIEIMYSIATKEYSQKSSCKLGFCVSGRLFLSRHKADSTIYAYNSVGMSLDTAVRAVIVSLSRGHSAFYAHDSFVVHLVSAITTIHLLSSLYYIATYRVGKSTTHKEYTHHTANKAQMPKTIALLSHTILNILPSNRKKA
jgi:hypothetical protein